MASFFFFCVLFRGSRFFVELSFGVLIKVFEGVPLRFRVLVSQCLRAGALRFTVLGSELLTFRAKL